MITIVMPYFNRKQQLEASLKSLELTKYNDFEVIVIDDASEEDQRIEDLINNFGFKIKLVRVEPKEKKWIAEPLALINKSIRECESEILIYQCAECLHVGDVVSSALENIREGVCLSFACLGLNEVWSKKTREVNKLNSEEILSIFSSFIFEKWEINSSYFNTDKLKEHMTGGIWWYNHSTIYPRGFPFCSAFTKEFYLRIGGFDEAFSYGFWWTDNDLVERIRKYGELVFIDSPFVIHQYHSNFWQNWGNRIELIERNRKILEENRRTR